MSDDDYAPVKVNTASDINAPDNIHIANITSATEDITISENVAAPDDVNITDVPVPDNINFLNNVPVPVPDDVNMIVSVPINDKINMTVNVPVSDEVNSANISNPATAASPHQSDIPAEATLLQNGDNTLVEPDSTSNNDHTLPLSTMANDIEPHTLPLLTMANGIEPHTLPLSTMANDIEPQLSSVRVTRKRRRKFFMFTDIYVIVRNCSWDLSQQIWSMIHGWQAGSSHTNTRECSRELLLKLQ